MNDEERRDHEDEPTERLPKTGIRVPVPKRKDVMDAIRRVSKPDEADESDERPDRE